MFDLIDADEKGRRSLISYSKFQHESHRKIKKTRRVKSNGVSSTVPSTTMVEVVLPEVVIVVLFLNNVCIKGSIERIHESSFNVFEPRLVFETFK